MRRSLVMITWLCLKSLAVSANSAANTEAKPAEDLLDKSKLKVVAPRTDSAPGSENKQKILKGLMVHFIFEPVKTDLSLKIYRLPIERAPDVGETQVLPRKAPMEGISPVLDGIFVRKGGIQPFLMVVENTSSEPKYFFATTHTVTPEEAGVGFGLHCLCNNHYFEVPPNSRWERVGVIKLEQHALGQHITFVHKLIGLTKEQISDKGLSNHAN